MFNRFRHQASIHGRPLSTQGHLTRTHFLGHELNINSQELHPYWIYVIPFDADRIIQI